MTLRHRLAATSLAAALALTPIAGVAVTYASAPIAAAAPSQASATAAATSWLAGQLTDGTNYQQSVSTTSDVLLGLLAGGVDKATADKIGDYLADHVQDATSAGQLAKIAIAAAALGDDPSNFGGEDLVADIYQAVLDGNGTLGDPYSDALAIIALKRADAEIPGDLVDSLIAQQNAQGEFFFGSPASAYPDPDTTGLAIQALDGLTQDHLASMSKIRTLSGQVSAQSVPTASETGTPTATATGSSSESATTPAGSASTTDSASTPAATTSDPTTTDPATTAPAVTTTPDEAVASAVSWAEHNRTAGGYWDNYSPVNTTGLVGSALKEQGIDVSSSVTWMLSQQAKDGGKGLPASLDGTDPDAYATAQGLLLLGGVTLNTVTLNPSTPTSPTTSPTAPSTSPTSTQPTHSATSPSNPPLPSTGGPATPASGSGDAIWIALTGVGVVGLGGSLMLRNRRRA